MEGILIIATEWWDYFLIIIYTVFLFFVNF